MMETQKWLNIIVITDALMIIHVVSAAKSLSEADRIVNLPGQAPVSFWQYAGYVAVDENQQRALFYYFAEAETEPVSKPLVLWLNGGPGCSSIGAGAFCEHGPFKSSGDILVGNAYSWNKRANMLYLESPAGVGFSYSANKSFYASVNDEMTGFLSWQFPPATYFIKLVQTELCFDHFKLNVVPPITDSEIYLFEARDNLAFLQKWFTKFPEYKGRDLFITGESYAGHYVPQLAELIIQSEINFNLKGIAIGNPLLEFNNDLNSRAEFFWSHGLISDATFEIFTSVCNYSQYRRERDSGFLTPVCSGVMNQVSREISKFIDVYDVTLDVCLSPVLAQSEILKKMPTREGVDVCLEDETVKYMNRKDVQEALHAQLVGLNGWTVCSDVLKYEMQDLEIPTVHVLGRLVRSGIRVLVYSGDQDSVIPLTGTRRLINGLAEELGLKTTGPYRAWFEGRQVAGWTQVYGDILSFATIRGASHEAPFSQPERSLVLFERFLAGKPLPEAEG